MYKTDVGYNAGIIWHLLAENQALTFEELKEYTKFDTHFLYLALGWLLREDKIRFVDSDGMVKIELSNRVSEMFY